MPLAYWRKSKDTLSDSLIKKISNAFLVYYKYQNNNILVSIYRLVSLIILILLKKYKINLMYKINNKLLIFFWLFIFYTRGFFLNENSSGGALLDYNHHFKSNLIFQRKYKR